MRTMPRFLSAGLMVRVSLACWSLVRDVCCEGVRLDGSCLHIRGRLSAEFLFGVFYIRFKFPNAGISLQGCFCFGFR